MRPGSKVIQLIFHGAESQMIALCEDGSVWWFDQFSGRFSLITEMDDGRYLQTADEE